VTSFAYQHAEAETSCAKLRVSEVDEDGCELSLGSTEADNGDYARDKRNSRGREGAVTVEGQQKGKRYNAKKPEVEESINNDLDDIKEACSGTEEGQKPVAVKGKLESEVVARSSFKGLRKRSKKVLFGEGTLSIVLKPGLIGLNILLLFSLLPSVITSLCVFID
jgi:hypothetical protein